MKKTTLLLLLLAAFPGISNAQEISFSEYLKKLEADRKASISEYVLLHPDVKQQKEDVRGNNYFLHHINSSGMPVYYQTRSNVGLATSIKTNKLWNGGGMSLNLHGQNMEVNGNRARLAVFEPGPVRTSHQEFSSRATTRDVPVFTTQNGNADHATHVAGTMIASGVVANAKGMANQAKIDCYEIQTDEYDEMLTVSNEGVLVSNHSYGPEYDTSLVTLGVYDQSCQLYDSIAFINKNYLQFHAAGNDRDEGNNIKYDILLGGCVAKNVATVGAVEILGSGGYTGPGSVTMSDFSSFGPTDDGRIKPDFCAPGVQIYSAISSEDTGYKHEDGTSMATPGAAGSMFLLQQHHKNKYTTYMRSATLRGLGVHTADECGTNPGPDYKYGWGLLNMEKAIDVLNNKDSVHYFSQAMLTNSVPYNHKVKTIGGAFKATICWTDYPRIPLSSPPINDRTAMLVNDLDLRIIDSATNMAVSTLPWKLAPDNPDNAATTGDNTVDNVEQIYISNLPAGTYFIRVTNKGSLVGGTQDFSVIVTGINTTVSENQFFVKNNTVKAYPNPFTDKLIIENNGWQSVTVVNSAGQAIADYTINDDKKQLEISTQNWASGIYYISVKTKDGSLETVSVIK